MPELPLEHSARAARFTSLVFPLLALVWTCAGLNAQDKAPKGAEQTLVQVNIITEVTGTAALDLQLGGKELRNYRPKVIEFFPSTGIVMDDKAHILAFVGYRWVNIHARNPRIEVIDAQGQKFAGKLIGIDQNMRVAVILCKGAPLKITPLCERCGVKDGVNVVMLVGSGERAAQIETAQVLSASTNATASGGEWAVRINRPLSMIGAPILDAQHRVVGVVADQVPSPSAPVDLTVYPVSQLRHSAEKILQAGGDIQTGWLGVYVSWEDSTPAQRGVVIDRIEQDSPAHKAGLLPNDVIVKWNGLAVQDPREFIQAVQDTAVGSKVSIGILRQGKPDKVDALIEARKPQNASEKAVIEVPPVVNLPSPQIDAAAARFQAELGVEVVPLTPQLADWLAIPGQAGLLVATIVKKTPFDQAGVLAGDIILGIDGTAVSTPQSFFDHLRSRGWGSRIVLRLLRKGADLTKSIQLPKLPKIPLPRF